MVYAWGMPRSQIQTTVRKSSAITNAANRLEIAEVKKLIHDSNVCHVAIEMAKTGLRPVWDEESSRVVMEQMSEAGHVEMIKFIVKKVLPDAKEIETTDDKQALDAWAEVIAREDAKDQEILVEV